MTFCSNFEHPSPNVSRTVELPSTASRGVVTNRKCAHIYIRTRKLRTTVITKCQVQVPLHYYVCLFGCVYASGRTVKIIIQRQQVVLQQEHANFEHYFACQRSKINLGNVPIQIATKNATF